MDSVIAKKNNSVIIMLALIGILVVVSDSRAQYYDWPEYSPIVAYDYQDEYGTIDPPTQVLDDGVYDRLTGDPVSTYIDGWWCFRWGSDKNPLVTENAWIPMLERFNEDFDYITNIMRWPRDSRASNGYYSTIYLYGSGLSTDEADNTATGGWQSSAGGHPMVLASYYPVYSFDPSCTYGDKGFQTGGMIHEGIHCILASMPGCFNSCWFHEGGNTWLQGTMEAQRSGNFSSIGWLSAGAAIAPFMPIECYSGWLQDGSFGGPCAQGVYQGDGICTWRGLLGGTQYGECFPHAMEVILGPKSIAWIWRYCSESGRVLQDLAEAPGGLGATQTRRLIQEYRARQAFCDFGPWSYAFRQLLNNNWNISIEEEWSPYWIDVDPWIATCYVATTETSGVLTPDPLTLPGWSGANQIPLTVNPSATEATVTFNPIGANMSCQLVYRDTSGDIHYGVPVSSGACSIPLANVRNNVIVAVICNTDYIYVDDTTRTTKYDYTLTMGAGVTGTANINTKWYDYNPASYTITATAGTNGTVSPTGSVSVSAGSSQTFTFTPDSGYKVNQVILNGLPIGSLTSYTFNNTCGDHTIEVTFNLIGGDEDPPTPDPATWAWVPAAIGTDTITMTATAGSDASGSVEYFFEETSGNPGGSDSGWQPSPTYTDTGLSEGMQYTYRVRMRDVLMNTGTWSASKSTLTQFTGILNIAPFASIDTSYVSPWETLEAVNDGHTPANSADNSNGAYGNWPASGGWNWVEYDFGTTYLINSTDVYWWDDSSGIVQPANAYIEYWNGSSWINAGNIGVALDQWNTLMLGVETSKLRVNMVSTDSTGILEWRVWGQVAAPSFTTDPISEIDAIEDGAYSSTLANDASDPASDPLTFSKDNGPAWLSVAANGDLSGIPNDSDVGVNTFTVRVTDDDSLYDIAVMTIDVANIYSGTQGLEDLAGLAAQWLALDCTDTPACAGADLDGDNDVTLSDFSILGCNWLSP